jgi:hypothetical protein
VERTTFSMRIEIASSWQDDLGDGKLNFGDNWGSFLV